MPQLAVYVWNLDTTRRKRPVAVLTLIRTMAVTAPTPGLNVQASVLWYQRSVQRQQQPEAAAAAGKG